MHLTATPSGGAARTLQSPISKQGLDREVQAALLRVWTSPECPEGNLRELAWDSNPDCGIAMGGSDGKASVYNAGDPGLISVLRRSPGEGNGNPLQDYCLEIPWTEEPGRLQSMGSQRVRHNWATSLSLSRHRQVCSQNKGLSRASRLWTSPSPTGDRQVRAARAGRGQSWPPRGILYQTASWHHC